MRRRLQGGTADITQNRVEMRMERQLERKKKKKAEQAEQSTYCKANKL